MSDSKKSNDQAVAQTDLLFSGEAQAVLDTVKPTAGIKGRKKAPKAADEATGSPPGAGKAKKQASALSQKFGIPPNLSFRRSIEISEGLMFSVMGDGTLRPIEVTQTTIRCAMGMVNAGYDTETGLPLEGEALEKAQNPTKPNIQSIDRASLDRQSDILELQFGVAFHGGGTRPDSCSRRAYVETMSRFLEAAREAGLYEDLAWRYLWNIVNGRALWRNGFGLPLQCVLRAADKEYAFNWGELDRDRFPGKPAIIDACTTAGADVAALVEQIALALSGREHLFAIDVAIQVRLLRGGEVWPSQEFAEGNQKIRHGREIKRILASRDVMVDGQTIRHGVIHSQKIGNAIRTVDEWHGSEEHGAIPVEVFGWVQSETSALRKPDNANFAIDAFTALGAVGMAERTDRLAGKKPGASEECIYTLAMIIRGGVFGISETSKAGKASKKDEKDDGDE